MTHRNILRSRCRHLPAKNIMTYHITNPYMKPCLLRLSCTTNPSIPWYKRVTNLCTVCMISCAILFKMQWSPTLRLADSMTSLIIQF